MTLTKLAKLANVSVSTASKAFSMSADISEETRKTVFETAKEHHCFRQFYNAKCPKLQVAILCPETKSRYYATLIDTLCDGLEAKNCEVCVSATDFNAEKCEELSQYYDRYATVDAVILIDSAVGKNDDYSVPTVVISGGSGYGTPDVFINSDEAFCKAVGSLISSGIKRIGYIGEPHTSNTEQRLINTLNKCGVEYDEALFTASAERFEKGGYDGICRLISSGKLPEAVVCAYDYMAIGALRALADNGKSVPRDISVIGVNNIAECEYLVPRLSSVGYSAKEVCEKAIEIMLKKAENKPYESCTVTAEFIKRESQR